MGKKHEFSNSLRLIIAYCAASCIYVPLLLILVDHSGKFYELGRIKQFYFALFCAVAEVLKLGLKWGLEGPSQPSTLYYFLKSLWSILVTVVLFYTIAVLLGAPVLDETEETLMFAMFMACLVVLPVYLNLGYTKASDMLLSLTTYKGDLFSEMIVMNVRFTLVGAWSSAVVIPLDWDRAWQKWPLPCILGALFGYLCGNVTTLALIIPKFYTIYVRNDHGKYGL